MNRKRNAICTSDWHIRSSRPEKRIDDFVAAQKKKISQIFDLCVLHDADLYLGGDVFDSPHVPKWLVSDYVELFSSAKAKGVTVFACAGQHDQIHHSKNLNNTAIRILFSAGLIQTGTSAGIRTMDWGAEVEPSSTLIAHYCVTPVTNELFAGSVSAFEFMRMHEASRIIVVGDYHVPHIRYNKDRTRVLINPGSIVRQGKDQITRKPAVVLLDTTTLETSTIVLDHEPAEAVFNLDMIAAEKARKERNMELDAKLAEYIQALGSLEAKPDFDENLSAVIADKNPSEDVKTELQILTMTETENA